MMFRYNYPLKELNTFGIDARAERYICPVTEEAAADIMVKEQLSPGNCLVLGGGSNILFTKDFDGTVIQPLFNNIAIEEVLYDSAIISAQAGLEWDKLVEWTVKNDFGGLENLSYIPGSVGAAPMQNIGAYGVEVSEYINRVHAVSIETGAKEIFSKKECLFGYRNSIFKNELKGKYLITKVEFNLKRSPSTYDFSYGNLERRVMERGEPSLSTIREAVISIRSEKLPDPSVTGNAGSFFKNPLISTKEYKRLKSEYDSMPYWEIADGIYKVPAAWLIENTGWKGKKLGQAAVHHKHALVLVNMGNASGSEILDLSKKIIQSVQNMFGIKLEREVNVI
ncbi:MAG TPA: UDP-N-acetylenolpyruvoylglucosamine reductase [Bacteroidales bacterium]|nr:UDP-N-acetylenolpyruvoylglucosamine reductase [Bacteroidales bacterium]